MKPRYKAIFKAVVDGIANREIAIGTKLPPQRDLAHDLGVATATVGRAYAELELEGFVTSHVGRGTYVVEKKLKYDDQEALDEGPIDLSTYRVQVPEIPNLLSDTLREIAASGAAEALLGAGRPMGQPRHRNAMSKWLSSRGIIADADQILMTNGGQHAIMAALSTLTHSGETIATESLTDPRMKSIAGYLDRRLAGVPCDDQGIIPSELERVCRDEDISAIFCTPCNQNPTNATMPPDRRKALVDIAERYDLPIVESDIYGTLQNDGVPPLMALAPHRTHFVTGLGRIAGPGIKVGCVVSPIDDVVRTQFGVAMSTGSATRMQVEILSRWVEQGRHTEMAQWQRSDTAKRIALLASYPLLGVAATHMSSPHAWLTLPAPWRSDEFVDAAEAHGVLVAPTHSFVVGRQEVPHAVRLVVGAPRSMVRLRTALDRLEKILSSPPRPHGRID